MHRILVDSGPFSTAKFLAKSALNLIKLITQQLEGTTHVNWYLFVLKCSTAAVEDSIWKLHRPIYASSIYY